MYKPGGHDFYTLPDLTVTVLGTENVSSAVWKRTPGNASIISLPKALEPGPSQVPGQNGQPWRQIRRRRKPVPLSRAVPPERQKSLRTQGSEGVHSGKERPFSGRRTGQAAGRTWRPCRGSLLALRPTLSRGLLFSMRYAVLPGLVLRSGTGKRGRLLPERSPFQGV